MTSRRSSPRKLILPRQSARQCRVRWAGQKHPGGMRSSPRSCRAFLGEEGKMANARARVENGSVEPRAAGRAYQFIDIDEFHSVLVTGTDHERVADGGSSPGPWAGGVVSAPFLPHPAGATLHVSILDHSGSSLVIWLVGRAVPARRTGPSVPRFIQLICG